VARSGELTSVIDERSVHRFRRETVFAMAVARGRVIRGIVAPPGVAIAIARQAFEMFDRGRGVAARPGRVRTRAAKRRSGATAAPCRSGPPAS